MQIGHRYAWVWLAISLVTLVLALDTRDWTWVVVAGLFTFSASSILFRYYNWPRRIRRQS